MNPTVVFFETSPWEETHLRRLVAPSFEVRCHPEELSAQTAALAKGAVGVSPFIYSRIGAEVLAALPDLRFIATRSTGFDHVDVAACRTRGIAVANVPTYGENTVAEHTFALILSLSRNVHKAYLRTVRGDFSLEGLQGFDLKGKTLGVVGAGNIGLHVIKMARGFGMEVVAFDVRRDHLHAEVLGFSYAGLEEVLRRADIVTLHAPYNAKTHHLIHRGNIGLMKKGALLINTARGALVETEALVRALDEGHIGGAGLDVLEGEELIREEREILSRNYPQEKLATLVQNHILMHRDNVVLTPHIGFYSKEAALRILETTIGNLSGFFAGAPQNLVSSGL